MKKAFLTAIMVIIGIGSAYAQKITLLSPNGGETWVSGSPQLIAWTYSGLSGNESIIIALEGATDYGPIAYSKVSQGSIEWPVGKKMDGGFAKPAADYKIIIEVRQNDSIYDLSDTVFSIIPATASISLMTPNGGEILEKGMEYDINWSFAGKNGFVSLMLVKDELPLGLIAENLPALGFRHRWHIGNPLLDGKAYGAGGNYRIQVQWQPNPIPGAGSRGSMPANAPGAADLQKNSDRSDGVFSISPGKGNKEAKAKDEKR
jgi:hypothetical protein